MTIEIATLLGLLLVAMVLFTFEWLSVDLVALLLVGALVVTGILSPSQAFAGFSSDIIIILASIFVLSGALVQTGATRWLSRGIDHLGARGERSAATRLMAVSATVSAFLNNTNTTAVMLPAIVRFARERDISASRLLMPFAFASMLGGTCTLVGTSTNVAASGLLEELGLEPFTLFEFSSIGVTVAVLGILYLATWGRAQLPKSKDTKLTEAYEITEYMSEVEIAAGSSLIGRTLADAALGDRGIQVLSIRQGDRERYPKPLRVLKEGERLVVQASRSALLALSEDSALRLAPSRAASGSPPATDVADEQAVSDGETPDQEAPSGEPSDADATNGEPPEPLSDKAIRLAEAIVMPHSTLAGRTLRSLDFRGRFGVSVLAFHRRGHAYPLAIADQGLEVGDVLLLEGATDSFGLLERSNDIRLLGDLGPAVQRRSRSLIAAGSLLAAVVAGSTGLLPLPVGFLLAAVIVVVTGCLTSEEAYSAIEWRVLVLIAGMTAFGVAMQESGAAQFLADRIAENAAQLGTTVVLAGFIVLTMALTQPMSNAAAVLVVLPVAVETARRIGVDPRSFAVAVTLAGSLSFITPLEPACLLVYGPGKYRFRDFVRVGLPLSALAIVVLLIMVPRIWPY